MVKLVVNIGGDGSGDSVDGSGDSVDGMTVVTVVITW